MRDPLRHTLGTAAKATGKSKTTIQRAISRGRISAEKTGNGGYSIDPSELYRVFPRCSDGTGTCDPEMDSTRPHDETPELRLRIEALETLLVREREVTEDIRSDRNKWRDMAERLSLAPPPIDAATPQKRRWWSWRH